jgi:putative salt-induced outer membrane protein YdiY
MKKLILVCFASLLAFGVWAAEATNGVFVHTITLGATLTEGNSDTMQATVGLLSEGEKAALGSIRAGVEGRYGESEVNGETEKTMENAKAFLDIRKTATERLYTVFNSTFLYDDIADIDYRATIGVGPGWYLIKTDSTALSGDLGPAYVIERVGGENEDYAALRLGERFEHKFSPAARIWQSAEYLAKMSEFERYFINAEVGAESAMTARVNLRFVLQDQYNSQPADDKDKNDLTFIAGISVKL